MSWEGYEVVICQNGHLTHEDGYFGATEEWKCPICNAPKKDVGVVDETNGLPYYLNFKVKILTPGEYRVCEHCGMSKLVRDATYEMIRVPVYESDSGNYHIG